jgi:hypothetical protein
MAGCEWISSRLKNADGGGMGVRCAGGGLLTSARGRGARAGWENFAQLKTEERLMRVALILWSLSIDL